jgi:hypothetical protein
LETPVDELILPEKVTSDQEITDEPHCSRCPSGVCGLIPESQRAQYQELADKLAQHDAARLVFLTHTSSLLAA